MTQTLFTSGMITAECERIAAIIGEKAYVTIGTNSSRGAWVMMIYPHGVSRSIYKYAYDTDLSALIATAEEAAREFASSVEAADREWKSWFADAALEALAKVEG